MKKQPRRWQGSADDAEMNGENQKSEAFSLANGSVALGGPDQWRSEESQHKGMDRTGCPGHGDGPFAVHPGGNGLLLAGLDISDDLLRRGGPHHAVPHAKRSSASRAPDERRSHGGKTADAEVHHALGFNRLYRSSCRFGARLSFCVVQSTFGRRCCRRWVGCGRIRIHFLCLQRNTFTSATIELAAGQKVISTGPYAVVRHPMYAGASLYLVGTPLALGSYGASLRLCSCCPL